MEFDTSRTLQDLEGDDWGEPEEGDDSHVVTTSHALRRKPLREFTAEDLRFMIGQQIGLQYLVPIALELLSRDPLASGHLYRGDLLLTVLRIDRAFWGEHQELIGDVESVLSELNRIKRFIEKDVADAADVGFRKVYYE
jgi:hypothetical protein